MCFHFLRKWDQQLVCCFSSSRSFKWDRQLVCCFIFSRSFKWDRQLVWCFIFSRSFKWDRQLVWCFISYILVRLTTTATARGVVPMQNDFVSQALQQNGCVEKPGSVSQVISQINLSVRSNFCVCVEHQLQRQVHCHISVSKIADISQHWILASSQSHRVISVWVIMCICLDHNHN